MLPIDLTKIVRYLCLKQKKPASVLPTAQGFELVQTFFQHLNYRKIMKKLSLLRTLLLFVLLLVQIYTFAQEEVFTEIQTKKELRTIK